jgi:hypothetical protein
LHHLGYLLQSGGFIGALGKLSLEDENEISIHPKNCIDEDKSDAIMDDLNSDEGIYSFQKLKKLDSMPSVNLNSQDSGIDFTNDSSVAPRQCTKTKSHVEGRIVLVGRLHAREIVKFSTTKQVRCDFCP